MGAMFAGIVAWLGTWFASVAASAVVRFVLMKVFFTALLFVALPIVFNTAIYKFMDMSLDMIYNATSGTAASGLMDFSGFMAWLIECFRLPECIAVLVAALQLRLILKMIPFSPVR